MMKFIIGLWAILLVVFFNLPYLWLDSIVCAVGYVISIVFLFGLSFWACTSIREWRND